MIASVVHVVPSDSWIVSRYVVSPYGSNCFAAVHRTVVTLLTTLVTGCFSGWANLLLVSMNISVVAVAYLEVAGFVYFC